MGLVIIALYANFPPKPSPAWQVYDALPNPLGWLLVIAGLVSLKRIDSRFSAVSMAALVAFVVSVVMWFPQLSHRLDASGRWVASLAQLLCLFLLCRTITALAVDNGDARAAKVFGLMGWAMVALAALPVLVFGAELKALSEPADFVSLVVTLGLVWFLFAHHRREWLGGPGPLEIHPPTKS